MKALLFIQKYRYHIGFFAMAGLCVIFFLQGLKKDYSFELFKQKIESKEVERQAILKERQTWEALYNEQAKEILTLKLKDSIMGVRAAAVETKIIQISKPEYVKEKIKQVENLSGNDMLNYIRNLPEPNDY